MSINRCRHGNDLTLVSNPREWKGSNVFEHQTLRLIKMLFATTIVNQMILRVSQFHRKPTSYSRGVD